MSFRLKQVNVISAVILILKENITKIIIFFFLDNDKSNFLINFCGCVRVKKKNFLARLLEDIT